MCIRDSLTPPPLQNSHLPNNYSPITSLSLQNNIIIYKHQYLSLIHISMKVMFMYNMIVLVVIICSQSMVSTIIMVCGTYVSDISNVNKTKYMLLVISSSKYIYMKIKKCVNVQSCRKKKNNGPEKTKIKVF